jgi:hypothetical protein
VTADEFRELVARMRDAQRRYFRWRDQNDLVASKDLEAQVDAAIVAPKSTLFDNQPRRNDGT